jgi:arsenate reductase-like glutaredoxin family protein
LQAWVDKAGWEVVLNRAGTTFKKLDEADRQDIDQAKAIELMLAQPSMIKRPVLEADGKLLIGFKPEIYENAFRDA